MSNVTDKQQLRDPWTDPDPQPEDFEAWRADPANVWYSVDVPANTTATFGRPEGVSEEEWEQRRAAARARGERMPEEIAAEENMLRRRAEEEKDWTPEQKAARQAEREAAEEAMAMRNRGETPTGPAVTWYRGGDPPEELPGDPLEQDQD